MKICNKTSSFISRTIIIIALFSFFLLFFCKVQYPYIFNDEKLYIELAKSFHNSGKFIFENKILHIPRVLYSILISPAFYFNKFELSFRAIQLFNHVVYVLSAIPIFLITRKLLGNQNQKNSLITRPDFLIVCAYLIMPMRLYANVALPETLFSFFFLFAFYFMWRFLCEPNLILGFSAITFFFLSFFTKQQAAFLLPVFISALFIELIYNKNQRKQLMFVLGTSLIVIAIISVFLLQKNYIPNHYFEIIFSNPKKLFPAWKSFIAQFLIIGWLWLNGYFRGSRFYNIRKLAITSPPFKGDLGGCNNRTWRIQFRSLENCRTDKEFLLL